MPPPQEIREGEEEYWGGRKECRKPIRLPAIDRAAVFGLMTNVVFELNERHFLFHIKEEKECSGRIGGALGGRTFACQFMSPDVNIQKQSSREPRWQRGKGRYGRPFSIRWQFGILNEMVFMEQKFASRQNAVH
ncbi:hypothetical protein CEXT_456961 [Caerostris extrusa]|uniref:Uncharacterized protein n=1 Tax=Caerostris extrusa TaxID=172846 RepID=A0AAV4MJC2_CAEEX|nr:hypothetical protein CEXT_456961 [Caerostris extrusa]